MFLAELFLTIHYGLQESVYSKIIFGGSHYDRGEKDIVEQSL